MCLVGVTDTQTVIRVETTSPQLAAAAGVAVLELEPFDVLAVDFSDEDVSDEDVSDEEDEESVLFAEPFVELLGASRLSVR
jgi:hypothetical protein